MTINNKDELEYARTFVSSDIKHIGPYKLYDDFFDNNKQLSLPFISEKTYDYIERCAEGLLENFAELIRPNSKFVYYTIGEMFEITLDTVRKCYTYEYIGEYDKDSKKYLELILVNAMNKVISQIWPKS